MSDYVLFYVAAITLMMIERQPCKWAAKILDNSALKSNNVTTYMAVYP